MKKTMILFGALIAFSGIEPSSASGKLDGAGVAKKRTRSQMVDASAGAESSSSSSSAPRAAVAAPTSKRSRAKEGADISASAEAERTFFVDSSALSAAGGAGAFSASSSSSSALAEGERASSASSSSTVVAASAPSPAVLERQKSATDIAVDGEINLEDYPPKHRILLEYFMQWFTEGGAYTIGKPHDREFIEEGVKVIPYTLIKGVDAVGNPCVEKYGYVVERKNAAGVWGVSLICYAERYKAAQAVVAHSSKSGVAYVGDSASAYEASRKDFRDNRINWRAYSLVKGGGARWVRFSPELTSRKNIHAFLVDKKFLSARIAEHIRSLN